MPTGIVAPAGDTDIGNFARRAESLGYDAVWVTELWGRDAFVALATAAQATDRIGLGTAIANVYGRSPATLAQAAASIADLADGRVRLGLGTSSPTAVEDLHGVDFANPPRRLHETCELVTALLEADGRVSSDGDVFDVNGFPSLETPLPVYAAALGQATRRATGRVADGWLPHNIPFDRLAEAFETIERTAREAGRDPNDIMVVPDVPCAVSEDGEAAIAAIRDHLAYYLGNADAYRRAAGLSFPDRADDVAAAWRSGDRDAARKAVSAEMIQQLAIVGTPEDARAHLSALADRDVVDDVIVTMPIDLDDRLRDLTAEALAPAA